MGVLRMSIEGIGPEGEDIVNVLHYQFTPPFDDVAELEEWMRDGWADGVLDVYRGALTTEYEHTGVIGTVIAGTDTGLTYELRDAAGTLGLLGGTSAPLQTAMCLRKRTGLAERSAQGRMFLSPRPVGDFNVDGRLTSTTPAGIEALRPQLTIPFTVGDMTGVPVVWSELLQGATPITSVTLSPTAAIRRSRRYNVGA